MHGILSGIRRIDMFVAFIPELDSKLRLSKDWTFDVHFEYRNSTLFVADGHPEQLNWRENKKPYKRTLKAGTEFVVSRIYVRSDAKDFSSVTLCVTKTDDEKLLAQKPKKVPFRSHSIPHWARFWVKLVDFNNAEFEVISDAATGGKPHAVRGPVLTMDKFRPTSRSPRYWVKFEHEDPELAFEGIVYTRALSHQVAYDEVYKPNWPVSKIKTDIDEIWDYRTQGMVQRTRYTYEPVYFVESLILETWLKKHKDNKKFEVELNGGFLGTYKAIKHPLEQEINLPKEKTERIKLGIKDGKTPLDRIPIAGGKLTVYKVDVEYK